jgi:predicted dehydrogenase
MGRSHLNTLEKMQDFEVVGLCDVAAESIDKARGICGEVAGFNDFVKMYDELKPDVVTVATQTRGHHGPTVASLERGISVLCEKPIAIDLQEADEMVQAGERLGAKLAINQQNHVNPAVRKGLQMVREGVVGEVVTIRGRNKCGRKSGNEFTEMGTHVADMMLCFGGAPEWCAGSVWWQGRLADVGDIMEAKEMSPKDRDSGLVVGERAVGQYGFANGVLGEVHFMGYEKLMSANCPSMPNTSTP